ncbi:hypothetical protein AB0H07_38515 [Streptomyces sp. NPDC021354]|uniref:hypothetical protein n=1 Tax=Streptomyces sp. NPDC021354 TaxID=3154793 RepID=UPI0034039B9F
MANIGAMFRGVVKGPGKCGPLAELLLGLALFAVAHALVCALHVPGGHRGPVSVREFGAVGASVERWGGIQPSDHRVSGGDGGCCESMAHPCDGPARVESLFPCALLLGLPALGTAVLNARPAPAHSAIHVARGSPPGRGADVLRMACVSRT